MHKILAALTSLSFLILTFACGHRGQDNEKLGKNSSPPKKDTAQNSIKTFVLTDPLSYLNPEDVACLRPGRSEGQLSNLPSLTFDGEFGEWIGIPPAIRDPLADAPAELDLGNIYLARSNSDLIAAISINRQSDTAIWIELGGLLIRQQEFVSQSRRLFRLESSELFEHNEAFPETAKERAVDPDQFFVHEGEDGIEIVLKERLLGDVLSWPAFWIKLKTAKLQSLDLTFDATAQASFASVLSGEESIFRFTACQEWEGQEDPFRMHFVIDRSTDRNSRHQITPPETAASWAVSLARSAFDTVSRTFHPLSLKNSETSFYIVGAKKVSQQRISNESQSHEAYRGLVLPVSELFERAIAYFPQGEIYTASVKHAVILHLLTIFPDASEVIVQIMGQAITDRILESSLGLNFLLDQIKTDSERFLAISDIVNPKPLMFQRWPDKEIAFGHILGSNLQLKVLRDIWIEMAKKAPKGASQAQALLDALLGQVPSPEIQQRMKNLWPGWLATGTYEKYYGPEQLRDQDYDGLTVFLEHLYGTNPERIDSDLDGWTDYGEILGGGDPLAATKKPPAIVLDGSFQDWLDLLPQKVTLAKGHSGLCPHAADITHFAAIAEDKNLILGAFASDFVENEPKVLWEATIDLPKQNRQIALTLVSGERRVTIRDTKENRLLLLRDYAAVVGRGNFEVSLQNTDLGLDPWSSEATGLKIRLRTIFREGEENKFCDETPWFAPEFTGKAT